MGQMSTIWLQLLKHFNLFEHIRNHMCQKCSNLFQLADAKIVEIYSFGIRV